MIPSTGPIAKIVQACRLQLGEDNPPMSPPDFAAELNKTLRGLKRFTLPEAIRYWEAGRYPPTTARSAKLNWETKRHTNMDWLSDLTAATCALTSTRVTRPRQVEPMTSNVVYNRSITHPLFGDRPQVVVDPTPCRNSLHGCQY